MDVFSPAKNKYRQIVKWQTTDKSNPLIHRGSKYISVRWMCDVRSSWSARPIQTANEIEIYAVRTLAYLKHISLQSTKNIFYVRLMAIPQNM